MTSIRLTIPRKLPSQNDWSNQRGIAAQFAYRKERDLWLVLIRSALTPKDPPDHKVNAQIVSYRTHTLDYGNLVGGAKMIPDVLKRLGFIRDDSPKWFACEYLQAKCKTGETRTTITLINP